MPFSATVNLGTVGAAITSVKLYGCTGNSGGNCTGCTVLTGYENVSVSTFPSSGLTINGIPNGVTYIQAEALGACSADLVKQCISISGIPGATPVPTSTLPPATPEPTPLPTATLPGATPPTTPGPTPPTTPGPTPPTTPGPTATAVPLPGCGDTVSDTYTPSTFTTQTKYLDLSTATNGSTITISYTANDRPNRFNIYGNGSFVTSSLWAGSDPDMGTTYTGPWTGNPIDSDGTGSFTFTYVAGTSYELRVDVGGANPNGTPPNPSDAWSVTIACSGAPTPTPTQTLGLTNCVRLTKDDAITGTENCNLDRVQRHEVTLYDADGANIQTAPYDITVTLTGTSGGTSTTWTFVIPQGSTSVYEDILITEYTGVCGNRDGRIGIFISGISAVSPTNIGVCTPAPTPSAGVTLNPLYYGQGLSTNVAHCGINYSINASFFTTVDTTGELLNQTIYTTDAGTQAFNGSGQWYPVKFTSGSSTQNGGYDAILINSNGLVVDIVYIDSNCDVNTY